MELLVICYHYIYSEENRYLKRGVRIEEFARHLAYLKDKYEIVHFADLTGLGKNKKVCIITFDDGLKEGFTKVFPLLQRLDVKATFFICSRIYSERTILMVQKSHMLDAKLGKEKFRELFYDLWRVRYGNLERQTVADIDYAEIYPYDDQADREFKLDLNYRLPIRDVELIVNMLFKDTVGNNENAVLEDIYLSQSEIAQMADSGLVEFGAHTHSHYLLSRLSSPEQKEEVRLSVDFLQKLINNYGRIPFSYPFGRKGTYNSATKEILAGDGRISWACSMQRKQTQALNDPFEIHRFDVNDVFSKEQV